MQAREKLNEARYFLKEMHRVKKRPLAFRYELSAFLAAARSVDYYLRAAAKSDPAMTQWLLDIRKAVSQGRYPESLFMINQRDINIHATPVVPQPWSYVQYEIKFEDDGLIPVSEVRFGSLNDQQPLEESAAPIALSSTASFAIQGPIEMKAYAFTDRPHLDVFLICSNYLRELDEIITEAEQKFPHL